MYALTGFNDFHSTAIILINLYLEEAAHTIFNRTWESNLIYTIQNL
jgi:hypothetical protein